MLVLSQLLTGFKEKKMRKSCAYPASVSKIHKKIYKPKPTIIVHLFAYKQAN